MPVDRKLLKQALSELTRLRSCAEDPTRFLAQLYDSALAEWAGQLGIDAFRLNELVLAREAVSGRRHP